MRKSLLAMTIFLMTFIVPTSVLAIDYEIDHMTIQAELQPDGDVYVVETQTYSFASSFNGITRTLYPKEGSSINNFVAFEGDQQLEVELEGNTFYIHRKGEASEKVTIMSAYIIKDGLEIYEDVAQFYWPFFDKRGESDYEQMDIIIYPPHPTADVQAIGYDTAENTEEVFDDGIVKFSLGKVKQGKNGDIRVLYGESLFPLATLTGDGMMKERLTSEIERDRKERLKRQERIERLKNATPTIFTIVIGILGIIFISVLIKRKQTLHDVERTYVPADFVPKEYVSLPAMIFFTTKNRLANTQVLSASLLDLVRRGFVNQIDEKTFKVVHRDTPYDHEIFLMTWLFNRVGENDTLHIDQLEQYVDDEEQAIEYQKDYQRWRELVKQEISFEELRDNFSILRIFSGIISAFLFPFIIMFVVYHLNGSMLLAMLLYSLSGAVALMYRPRTSKGVMIKQDWDNFIEKYSTSPNQYLDQLTDEERQRAYLYSFALEDIKMIETNEQLTKGKTLSQYSVLDPLYFLIFTKMAQEHFDAAFRTSRVHYTTSSSGGGGRGGVGGGGGGSGAF